MKVAHNPGLVVDSSVAIAWVVKSQANEETDRLLDQISAGTLFWVPSLWPYEVANVLLSLMRRGKITPEQRGRAQAVLDALEAQIDDEGMRRGMPRTVGLADTYGLSVYDAAYLELAIRRALPLATRDENLIAAARKCRVEVRP